MLRLSVIMSVFNNAPYLDEAVDSIRAQTMADFEFIIVDDGSSDGSTEILRRHAAADPRIRLIEQENRGLVASLNRAIAAARAPWIARMDGDDVAMPERFERQLRFVTEHPDYGVVGCQLELIDEGGRTIKQALDFPRSHDAFLTAMEWRPIMSHPAAMIARDLLDQLGGYRAIYRHCEDYDLWLRLSERTKLCSLEAVLLRYRFNPNQVSNRHLLEQKLGAAIAWEAHLARIAGGTDPLEGCEALPPPIELDRTFGREGVAARVCAKAAQAILYDVPALAGPGGVAMLVEHARRGGDRRPLWRAAVRLVRSGHAGTAARLLFGLMAARDPGATAR